MKYTNKNKLPQPIYDLVAKSEFKPTEKSFGATSIINPLKQTLLLRRHFNDIEVDVSDRVFQIFGSAVHKVLENANTNGNAEMRISKDMGDGFRLSGVIDLYNEKEKVIEDYKTASVNKILFKDFSEWEKQGLIYWYLLNSQGKDSKELRFHAMLKDWVARKLMLARKQGNDYPNSAIWTWTHKITDKDKEDIEKYINERFKLLKQYYDTPDDELPPCSSEECWYTGNKYAVMKKGRKTALRVFEDFEEAKAYMAKNGGDYIEHREGEYRRCEDYCDCNMYCSEYLKRKGE